MPSPGLGDGTVARLIVAGTEALGLELSARQLDSLARYVVVLQRWNSTYNLTAVRDPAEIALRHVLDCLAVIGPLRRQRVPGARARDLDVGSGAGLPGL